MGNTNFTKMSVEEKKRISEERHQKNLDELAKTYSEEELAHFYRKYKDVPYNKKKNYVKAALGKLSSQKAINLHCSECMGWGTGEDIVNCCGIGCPFYKLNSYQLNS